MLNNSLQLLNEFRSRFGSAAKIYRAPGRVNLIGEHTDYNDGFVLPAAIEFYCSVAAAPRLDRKLVIYSENFKESAEGNLDAISGIAKNHWSGYPLGVAWAIEASGKRLKGANLLIRGEVPLGAGLSSSAAIEVATGFALLDQGELPIDLKNLAEVCQKAENEFVGAHVGIMDQFVSCHGRASHALLLDCRSLEYNLVKLPPGIHLVICNSMVRHEIGSSEYNLRRAECQQGVRALRQVLPEIRALRDVTLAQLQEHRGLLSAKVYSRCHHVVTENGRVQSAVAAFESGDLRGLGRLMSDSHRSLRDDYEVSSKELDLLVELATAQPGVVGARMTGGGFGGCTINLVKSSALEAFKKNVAAGYFQGTGRKPEIYVSPAADGVYRWEASSDNAHS